LAFWEVAREITLFTKETLMTGAPATPGDENLQSRRHCSFNNLREFSEEPTQAFIFSHLIFGMEANPVDW